ncbi:MAG TPA: cyanophycin synthetase [Candidatus Desulfobacillus denitrificans]|nr:cyanophycin synthetase [Candidatus Desulfobacillus denitrificans]HNT63277.1 cyanophycin synthetase [Candidatus Desulfobacillus denitrificans]
MKFKDIEILRITPLRGPTMWTYRPIIEAWVDIGELEDWPSNKIPGFYERLSSWLPSLIEHRCSEGDRGGFLQRLREGTWTAHILEHVTLELQNLAGQRTGFGKARQTSKHGVYKMVVRSRQEQVTRACLAAGRDLVMAAINDSHYDVPGTIEKLRELADKLCLGPSTTSIVDAAGERGIPFIRLNDGNLVQLGYGAGQRRIWTAETDSTSAIAESISRDKDLTKTLLASCGVPVPEGRIVSSPEDAWEAAEDIGLPVAVKPTDANHARGVSLELTSREQVEAAYHVALEEGSEVMVERYVPGVEHRLLVVGNRLVAATRGETACVVGDGKTTIVELIDQQINSDPRCGEDESFPLEPIRVEREPAVQLELKRQGFAPESVPPAGKKVLIIRYGNLADDVTDEVHPDVAEAATLAARVVGLDIAGVDIVAEDISRPLDEQRGAIVEVNAGPGLLMHLKPAKGKPRPVGEAIADSLFPSGGKGRIPIVGIAGTQGTNLIARLVAWLLQLTGKHVGLACRDGLFLDKRQVEKKDSANWAAGQRLLINRSVEAAVFENGPAMILGEGIAYDRCQVGIVTDAEGAETLGEFDIHTVDQLYHVLRTQVDIVLPEGVAVLNAADPHVVRMAELCDGEVIFYGLGAELPAIVAHRAKGGRALYLRDNRIMLATGAVEGPFLELPVLANGKDDTDNHRAASLLAAVGAAVALDIPVEMIRVGIETFEQDRNGKRPARSRPRRVANQ